MPYQIWLYLLGWLCMAVGIACHNRKKRGGELNSFDVITILILAGRKSKVTG